jgi:hypothetical protein
MSRSSAAAQRYGASLNNLSKTEESLDETMLAQLLLKKRKNKTQEFDNLDVTSQQIINILEEYVKPAVAADGGNIVFDSYNEKIKL